MSFCVPSITNTIFVRRWMPSHKPKNASTKLPRFNGDYEDAFGNKVSVLAVSNPGGTNGSDHGYGILRMNKSKRTITIESWPRDVHPTQRKQYTG